MGNNAMGGLGKGSEEKVPCQDRDEEMKPVGDLFCRNSDGEDGSEDDIKYGGEKYRFKKGPEVAKGRLAGSGANIPPDQGPHKL